MKGSGLLLVLEPEFSRHGRYKRAVDVIRGALERAPPPEFPSIRGAPTHLYAYVATLEDGADVYLHMTQWMAWTAGSPGITTVLHLVLDFARERKEDDGSQMVGAFAWEPTNEHVPDILRGLPSALRNLSRQLRRIGGRDTAVSLENAAKEIG